MTRKTYCGNLLWQSGLTLLAPYNFAQFFDVGNGYSEYGDEEIRMRAIERTAVYYVELDWANPGCQYSDKPYGPKK